MKRGTRRLLGGLCIGSGLVLLLRGIALKNAIPYPLKEPMPVGAKPTGKLTRTTNGAHPDDATERLSYAVRDWVQVSLPDGQLDWIEIDRREEEGIPR